MKNKPNKWRTHAIVWTKYIFEGVSTRKNNIKFWIVTELLSTNKSLRILCKSKICQIFALYLDFTTRKDQATKDKKNQKLKTIVNIFKWNFPQKNRNEKNTTGNWRTWFRQTFKSRFSLKWYNWFKQTIYHKY